MLRGSGSILTAQDQAENRAVVDAVVALGMQTEVLAALRERTDPEEAIRRLSRAMPLLR